MRTINYKFIGKCLYFPEKKIVAIGDLHMGYEEMMHDTGVLFPVEQLKETISEFDKIFKFIKKKYGNDGIDKIILLGDLKHNFPYKKKEKFDILGLFEFFRKHVSNENIIVVKGNHDKIDIGKDFVNYYVDGDIVFVHGDKDFPELWKEEIKLIVMGHYHSAIILGDESEVKKEKYKCFLRGEYKGKSIVIVPSFLNILMGRDTRHYEGCNKDFKSIVKEKDRKNFEVFVVNDDLEEGALNFGKVKNLN